MLHIRHIALAVLSSMVFVSTALADDYMKCESVDNKREYCDVNGGSNFDVRLSRQLSDSSCVEGTSWGRNNRGVWVDHGCRAEFSFRQTAAAQPTLTPLNCPPGTHPSTHRCTKAERKKGCKDYGANDGTGRGCSNF